MIVTSNILVSKVQYLHEYYGRQVHCILELDTLLSVYTMSCTLGYSDVNNCICLELRPNAMHTSYFSYPVINPRRMRKGYSSRSVCVSVCLLPS